MNHSFKPKQPRFKTLDERKTTGSQRQSDRERKPSNEPKYSREQKYNSERKYSSEHKAERLQAPSNIYPSEARKAGGEGTVKISLKGTPTTPQKKTGALSPRAPEKIKHNRATEMKIYGENACLTLFQQRPDAIVRLWATVEMAKKCGALLSYLADQKKAYHIVDNAEMGKVTGTEHHGEICLLVKKQPSFSLEGYLQVPRQRGCLVLLDNVHNAQNIGGILRTCAFYGVKGVIVEQADALNASNTARVAEGGLEFIHALETKHKQIALTQLRHAGYQIVHLTQHKQATALAKTKLNSKVVFVLSEIVPDEIEFSQDSNVVLSFSNPLNSGLNVAVNAGILLAQWYHAHIV